MKVIKNFIVFLVVMVCGFIWSLIGLFILIFLGLNTFNSFSDRFFAWAETTMDRIYAYDPFEPLFFDGVKGWLLLRGDWWDKFLGVVIWLFFFVMGFLFVFLIWFFNN